MAPVPAANSNKSGKDAAKSSVKATQTDKEPGSKKAVPNPFPDQCGLEDDGSEWFESDPSPRIKETRATAEERVKYQGIVDKCLHADTVFGKLVDFDPNDVVEVMIRVQEYLASEQMLIADVPFGAVIVGDLHGQLYDLDRVFKAYAKDGKPGYLCARYVFLGDYVDRGRQSLEVIMLLFSLKILYPDNFFLLRGNHEFSHVNIDYGFAQEIDQRYIDETAPDIYAQCNETFNWLSIAAIVGNTYYCVHGGVSPRGLNRDELISLPKPVTRSSRDYLIQDAVWADPAVGLRGSCFNYDRGLSIYFGLDVLVFALHQVQCIALFRGHSISGPDFFTALVTAPIMNNGFENLWDTCYTVFTATGMNGTNDGAVAFIDENGKIHVTVLKLDVKRQERELEMFGASEKSANMGMISTHISRSSPKFTCDDAGGGKAVRMPK